MFPGVPTPNLHVNEIGNILKGPPLRIPGVIPGAFASTMNMGGSQAPYVNPVGNQSQIGPPVSGLPLVLRGGRSAIVNDEVEREPVGQGSSFGHVLNDEEGELDARQLNGINQIPAQATFNLMYQPYSAEGSLFTTQLPPPPGAPLSSAAAARATASSVERPRIPGVGGLGPRAHEYKNKDSSSSRNSSSREKGRSVSVYDAVSSAVARDSRSGRSGLRTSANLAKARLIASSGVGVGNSLEAVNPQSQRILADTTLQQGGRGGGGGGGGKKNNKKRKGEGRQPRPEKRW